MKANRNCSKSNKVYFWIIGISILVQVFIALVQNNTAWVERYYSRLAYPLISYINTILFSWVPFSVGDIFYALLLMTMVYLFIQLVRYSIAKQWRQSGQIVLKFCTLLFGLYSFFYVNWGLNYYREPVAVLTGLDVRAVDSAAYFQVLEKYIQRTNELRAQLDLEQCDREVVKKDIEAYMKRDTLFDSFLSKTQITIKQPLSSRLASYFTVSGYFNPFTSEVQVNQRIPSASYPFVNVHELAHQMGIGFEDDCNFIAFRKLAKHENKWYQYSAYYSAVESLLRPFYSDKTLMDKYSTLLSPRVKADFKAEYEFWHSYSSWLDRLSAVFYDGYLKHNNQPEGLARYSMMARLIVAWEMQQ